MRDQLRTIGRCNVLILGSSRTTRAHFVAPLGGRRNGNRGWKRNAVTPSLSEQREGSRRRKSCSPISTVATQAVDSQGVQDLLEHMSLLEVWLSKPDTPKSAVFRTADSSFDSRFHDAGESPFKWLGGYKSGPFSGGVKLFKNSLLKA